MYCRLPAAFPFYVLFNLAMPKELSTALITLADLDDPEVAMFAHEEVIRQLLKDGVEMSHAHTVLCTADYLYSHGLTAVPA